jgi:MinD-like ATPase involved in chromosome partitioning or flagellar assembly
MYISTFYSFKGGVGRSLALANIATELVIRGKRVLIVDFDLEAPGLHTFDFGNGSLHQGGIVDYVEAYLNTNESPQIENHIVNYESDSYPENGKLWLMPAGKLDDSYSSRLSRLDWNDLYENRDGFLFFEDLKAQWKSKYNPDYVLIDSRTGHTDVGGICTRQLPNSVVFLFFPNEQNLTGLEKVVKSLDLENNKVSDDFLKIEKHFVSSNVPDLDDELQILSDRLTGFSTALGYEKLTAQLHRYNSLNLLEQDIFTLRRPKTRLAEEYRKLTDEIILKNYEDVDGSTFYLQGLIESKNDDILKDFDARLLLIQNKHKENSSILSLISQFKEKQGDISEALALISKAIDLGDVNPISRLRQAKMLKALDQDKDALDSLEIAIKSPDLSYFNTRLAINLIRRIDKSCLHMVLHSIAFKSLAIKDSVELLAIYFSSDYSNIDLSIEVLKDLIEVEDNEKLIDGIKLAKNHLSLLYISKGLFLNAMPLLSETRPDETQSINIIFNYAVAEWGALEVLPVDLFELVLTKAEEMNSSSKDFNFQQCISLCYWAVGNSDKAIDVAKAIKRNFIDFQNTFSAWSFLRGTAADFKRDIDEMIDGFEKESVKPRFLSTKEQLF